MGQDIAAGMLGFNFAAAAAVQHNAHGPNFARRGGSCSTILRNPKHRSRSQIRFNTIRTTSGLPIARGLYQYTVSLWTDVCGSESATLGSLLTCHDDA